MTSAHGIDTVSANVTSPGIIARKSHTIDDSCNDVTFFIHLVNDFPKQFVFATFFLE